MNLIILSSIPKFAIVLIVIEAIVTILLGGFLVADMIRSKIHDTKKARQEEKEKNYQAAQKSMEIEDHADHEEEAPEEAKAHLSYLERLNAQQKEYVMLLEKELKLRKELQDMGADVPLASDVDNYVAPEDEDDEFAAFLESVPEKNNEEVVEEPIEEEALEEEAIEIQEDTILDQPETKQVVITASSISKNQEAKASKPKKTIISEYFEEDEEVINFHIIDPWYKCAPSYKKDKD
jgi:Na+-translocating ferredoxin:NAD+ oxidoreductase RnfG subunit